VKVKFSSESLMAALGEDNAECPFSGFVEVDVPPHHERTKFVLSTGVGELAGMGKLDREDAADVVKKATKVAEIAERSSKMVFERVTSCDLKHVDGETVITTPDDLWSHPDATPLVEGLIQKFTTNFASGKKKPS
jgi:hypothetical protein